MGVKISKAQDANTGKIITTGDCEKGHSGKYICPTQECDALLSFIPSFERRLHNKVSVVPSYFKLQKHQQHNAASCPHNTEGAVDIIARSSDDNIKKSLEDGKYDFSLQVLHKPRNQQVAGRTSGGRDAATDAPQKQKRYSNSGTASTYIKALAQVMVLRSKLEDDKELAAILRLSYRGKKIRWNRFYFEVNDYRRAYDLIESGKAKYPLCFHGEIARIAEPTDTFPYYSLSLFSPYADAVDGVRHIAKVQFSIRDEDVDVSEFEVNQHILVYGETYANERSWTPQKQEGKPDPAEIRYLNINLSIYHAAQIMTLDEDD